MRSEFIAAQQMGEVGNVVLMGSGEPLDNYDNVVGFIRALSELHGMGIRHISLSTCGLVPGIEKLAEEGLPVTLCISLHSAIDAKRKQIMPTASAFPVKNILAAADAYFQKTGRRVIIEYTLIRGFNDGAEDIEALVHALHGMNCHVNVIPLNVAAGQEKGILKPPGAEEAHAFAAALEKRGLSATVRRSLGSDIEGACGQLKLKREKS
jgi:23S rRNA (adenine2503-C2)-methyltransferase